jgi:hypothetical protein
MIEYIKELINTIKLHKIQNAPGAHAKFGGNPPDFNRLLEALVEEINRLDPRDFEPAARHDFVAHRAQMRIWVGSNFAEIYSIGTAERIGALLDSYAGEGTRAKTRDFTFVSNPDIRAIVERDYRELALRTLPDGSWKSTVILAGSILEAVLYDRLTKDSATVSQAMSSPKAPPKGPGAVKDITKDTSKDEWRLNDLIKVACDLQLLPHKDEQAIHLVLREYRNFVHPRLEVEMGIKIGEGHAMAAKGMLDVILDHLTSAAV